MSNPSTLRAYRGTDYVALITCQDSDGVAVDITGYTALAHVRKTPTGALVLNLGAVVSDGAAGEISINLTAAQTLALTADDYVYDLLLEDGDGVRTGPYVSGKFIVAEPVSKF